MMLSRVADHLYWMSRYLERAEHTARLIDVFFNVILEQAPERASRHWDRLLDCLEFGSTFSELEAEGWDAYRLTQALTFDRDNASSILSCISGARDNARQVRELISSEMWQEINRLYLSVQESRRDEELGAHPHEFYQTIKEGAQLFQGITDSTTYRGQGWHFIQLGRFIERAGSLAILLDVHFERRDEAEYLDWVALLKCCTAFEAFCKVYSAELVPSRIVQFLLMNSEFPHSVRFSVDRIDRAIGRIGESALGVETTRVQRQAGRLVSQLRFGTLEEVLESGLGPFLHDIRSRLVEIHDAVYQAYIAYPIEQALEANRPGAFW
ncbi:MAG: alpha-E domain-containing protein [Candidatus Eremiobacterota bacterium]